MSKKLKFTIGVGIIIFYSLFLIFVEYHIGDLNRSFFHGKDDGFIVRVQGLISFGALLFIFRPEKIVTLLVLFGGAIAVISIITSYLFWFLFLEDNGVIFHVIGALQIVISYFLIPTIKAKKQHETN